MLCYDLCNWNSFQIMGVTSFTEFFNFKIECSYLIYISIFISGLCIRFLRDLSYVLEVFSSLIIIPHYNLSTCTDLLIPVFLNLACKLLKVYTSIITSLFFSRDNTSLEELLCERWITTLIERAGFYSYVSSETGTVKLTELPEKEIAVESLKCLCNLTFNSPAARAYCANTSVAQSLVARFQAYNDIPYKYDIMLYDMKLLFILTALRQDIKLKIINELDGMNHLTRCLKELLLESVNPSDDRGSLEEKQCVLSVSSL